MEEFRQLTGEKRGLSDIYPIIALFPVFVLFIASFAGINSLFADFFCKEEKRLVFLHPEKNRNKFDDDTQKIMDASCSVAPCHNYFM